ncbi:hypothetical protein BD408DRAFT_429390 [Parasitella parasitica]|nr:hypothetical protein BD408DRAFT_429390 [Parasitella parasitica]
MSTKNSSGTLQTDEILCKIPAEILMMVFYSNLDSKQLGECKRVCKKWYSTAEDAMFRIVKLDSTEQFGLFQKAFVSADRKPFVEKFTIGKSLIKLQYDVDFLKVYNEVMDQVFTPNLTSLVGHFINEDLYEVLLRNVEDPNLQFTKLRCIPRSISPFSLEKYYELALKLSGTLEEVFISSNDDANFSSIKSFGEFKNLKTTCVGGYLTEHSLTNLNDQLDTHDGFKTLEFSTFGVAPDEEEYDIKNWFSRNPHYKTVSSLNLLKIEEYSDCSACLEYSLTKFKKIDKAKIEMKNFAYLDNADLILRKHTAVLDMLRVIPKYEFTFLNHTRYKDLKEKLIAYVCSDKNSVMHTIDSPELFKTTIIVDKKY